MIKEINGKMCKRLRKHINPANGFVQIDWEEIVSDDEVGEIFLQYYFGIEFVNRYTREPQTVFTCKIV